MRRSPLDTLNSLNHERTTSKQIYVGAKLNIFGRQFNITDYADDVTKFKLSSHRESYVSIDRIMVVAVWRLTNLHLIPGRFAF